MGAVKRLGVWRIPEAAVRAMPLWMHPCPECRHRLVVPPAVLAPVHHDVACPRCEETWRASLIAIATELRWGPLTEDPPPPELPDWGEW